MEISALSLHTHHPLPQSAGGLACSKGGAAGVRSLWSGLRFTLTGPALADPPSFPCSLAQMGGVAETNPNKGHLCSGAEEGQ